MRPQALVVVVAALACVALSAVGGAGATPPRPFIGTWWAVDPSDGSTEQLTFGAGGDMFFRDDSAHVCAGVQAFAKDTGTVDQNTWTGSGAATLRCPADDGMTIPNVFFQFTLNSDGTLSGSIGDEVWTRTRP